ncbi:MAG: hypothetical protein ACE5GK_09665 [Nitrospiria bacterium]
MKTHTRLIVVNGEPGSEKTSLASFLAERYRKLGIKALLINDSEIEGAEVQRIFDANRFNYIILTMLPDKKMKAPCLEHPFQTITLPRRGD